MIDDGIVQVVRGDLTRERSDAVVNVMYLAGDHLALTPTGRALFRVGGPQLEEAVASLGEFGVGQARLTSGFGLPAGFAVHLLLPSIAQANLARTGIARGVAEAVTVALRSGAHRVSLPPIGPTATQPLTESIGRVMLGVLHDLAFRADALELVRIVCPDAVSYEAMVRAIERGLE